MITNNYGVFRGVTTFQKTSEIGGSRYVFVILGGKQNDNTMPIGGRIKNPFTGKIFAGDLVEYNIPTDNAEAGATIKVLKTFTVADTVLSDGTEIKIVKNGYTHRPTIGEVIMKAPNTLTGKGAAYAITNVVENDKEYVVTVATTIGALAKGDILVNGASAGPSVQMLVTKPNAIVDCDYDMIYEPSFAVKGAKYDLTPIYHGVMWKCRMSALPKCVEALNKSNVDGWFEI